MPKLPDTYQRVKYIQNSGTQYIDTGYYPNDKTTVQAKFIYTNYNGGAILGGGGSGETDQFRFFRYQNNTYLDYGSGSGYNRIYGSYITSTTDIYEMEFGNRYVKDIPTDTVKFSGGTVSFSAKSYTFKILESNGDFAKMYYVKIYDDGTLVRDLVPCYRKSDGVIGMYDTVNNVFYTNSGTGTFIKGPEMGNGGKVYHVYVGDKLVRPQSKWTLYKETDFKNSSFGGFRTAGWYNASSPSYTGFNTTDGYIYSTSSHARCKICPDTNDLALFQSAKAIKIVTDGIYIGNNTNRYNSWVGLGGWWQEFGKKSSGMNYPTLLSGTALTYGVWYKSETILTKEDSLITTLDNGSSYGITYQSGLWNQLVSTSSNSYFYPSASDNLMCMAEVALDNGTTSYLKDVHVYLLF